MTLSELEKQIKSNTLKTAYFFYGEEVFLLEDKVKAIKKRLIPAGTEDLNYLSLEGKKADLNALEEFIDSFPQMSERKLAVIKNTGFFSNMNSAEAKRLKQLTAQLAPDTCLVFAEPNFDKKKEKNLDFVAEKGGVVRFDYLSGNQAEVWLDRLFEKSGKRISERDVSYLVRQCGPALGNLYSEFTKLVNFMGERGAISRADIDAVIVKSTEAKMFDMFDDIVEARRAKVMRQFQNLMNSGDKPGAVMNMLVSKLSELLMVKLLKEEGLAQNEIAEYFDFKRPAFVVNKTAAQSKRFGEAYLRRMIYKGLQYDLAVKSGRLNDRAAAEMYIAELLK